jgi:uncharacterized protein
MGFPISREDEVERSFIEMLEQGKSLQLRILEIAESGTKSRVETRIQCSLRVVESSFPDRKLLNRASIRISPTLLAREQSREQTSKIDAFEELFLDACVLTLSEPQKMVYACDACVMRERKRYLKKLETKRNHRKASSTLDSTSSRSHAKSIEDTYQSFLKEYASEITDVDRERILSFYCPLLMDFSEGEVNVPFRITCYCRHHEEREGFQIEFTLKHIASGRLIVRGRTPSIMIVDDHKTSQRKSMTEENFVESSPSSLENTPPWFHRKRRVPFPGETNDETCPDSYVTELGESDEATSGSPSCVLYENHPHLTYLNSPHAFGEPIPGTRSDSNWAYDGSECHVDELFRSIHNTTSEPQLETEDHQIKTQGFEEANHRKPLASSPDMPDDAAPLPTISRVIPIEGPLIGGIDVTILGSNFHGNLGCLFGGQLSPLTHFWGSTTLICVLPPAYTAGTVAVTLTNWDGSTCVDPKNETAFFTYKDDCDKTLLELALQVVGVQLTGRIEEAKDVAMRIMSSNSSNPGETLSQQPLIPLDSSSPYPIEDLILRALSNAFSIPIRSESILSLHNYTRHTMLHIAAFKGYEKLLDFLLHYQISVNLQDKNGNTALHLAILSGRASTVELLTRCLSMDRQIRNAYHETAMELAIRLGHYHVSYKGFSLFFPHFVLSIRSFRFLSVSRKWR